MATALFPGRSIAACRTDCLPEPQDIRSLYVVTLLAISNAHPFNVANVTHGHTRGLLIMSSCERLFDFAHGKTHIAPFVTELKTGDRMVVQDRRGNVVKDTVNEQRQRLANKPRDASAVTRRLR